MPPVNLRNLEQPAVAAGALRLFSPLKAHDLLHHVLNILRAEEHAALVYISQKPVLI